MASSILLHMLSTHFNNSNICDISALFEFHIIVIQFFTRFELSPRSFTIESLDMFLSVNPAHPKGKIFVSAKSIRGGGFDKVGVKV